MLYDYLKETYGENEPIFVSELRYDHLSSNAIRQQIMKLTNSGKLKRYDTGIYFIPQKSIFRSGSQISRDKVIEKKYLIRDGKRCGYISGVLFANQLGLTTQIPANCELVSNQATNDVRRIQIASTLIILRRPKVKVTDDNYRFLQLLDLFRDMDYLVEVEKDVLQNAIENYMNKMDIQFDKLTSFFPYYPNTRSSVMYEAGVLQGVSAS